MNKVVYNYDENGNLTIATKFDSASVLENKTTYSNFDKTGNWQKQLSERIIIKDEKESVESADVTYRTIIYF